ncbi:AbrB/MazE/SpoVT family DNA-binding domain-containing protein [Amycolatopsis anabasis]|uniref:AbrB/MazE/SpoVT family DNA-binding domain-containing protein n=1 Tax=Amycolatopsis anabasis TaxID=1840409 RepID=UPI00131C4BC7|nr:AbrB/MazE/SpoVT family DNA-binding domain-containing protein [Amycolatopsis anabasis]
MAHDEDNPFYGPGGRGFYGAVTVSSRGQIVLPAQARRDLGIEAGNKLLVLGDPEQGLALLKIDSLMHNLRGSSVLLEQIQKHAVGEPEAPEPGDGHP